MSAKGTMEGRLADAERKINELTRIMANVDVRPAHQRTRRFQTLLGKTDGVIGSGASGTISIWTGASGSETDSGQNVTAYNHYDDLSAGQFVLIHHNGFAWYVESVAEPPPVYAWANVLFSGSSNPFNLSSGGANSVVTVSATSAAILFSGDFLFWAACEFTDTSGNPEHSLLFSLLKNGSSVATWGTSVATNLKTTVPAVYRLSLTTSDTFGFGMQTLGALTSATGQAFIRPIVAATSLDVPL